MSKVEKLLISRDNPDGVTLEHVLRLIRREIIDRCASFSNDERLVADYVMHNNIRILDHISDAIELSEDNTRYLDKHLGPAKPGQPRLG